MTPSRLARLAAALVALALLSVAPRAEAEELRWEPCQTPVRPWELVLGGLFTAGAVTMRFAFDPPPARWQGGVLFDRPVRDALRVSTHDHRETAGAWSDYFWYATMAAPVLIDAGIVALGVHRAPQLAWELLWVDLMVITASALLATSTENIGRERPMAQGCPDGADPDEVCGSGEENRSFLSGHTVAAFAGAGLVCSTHERLALWGGGAADVAPCAGMLAMATAAGVLRISSDNHWATDVLLSGGIGFAVGWFLPRLHFGPAPPDRDRRTGTLTVVPVVGEVAGVAVVGAL